MSEFPPFDIGVAGFLDGVFDAVVFGTVFDGGVVVVPDTAVCLRRSTVVEVRNNRAPRGVDADVDVGIGNSSSSSTSCHLPPLLTKCGRKKLFI